MRSSASSATSSRTPSPQSNPTAKSTCNCAGATATPRRTSPTTGRAYQSANANGSSSASFDSIPANPGTAWASPSPAASPSNTTATSPATPLHTEPASHSASQLTGRRPSPDEPGVSPDPNRRLGRLRQTASRYTSVLSLSLNCWRTSHRSHQVARSCKSRRSAATRDTPKPHGLGANPYEPGPSSRSWYGGGPTVRVRQRASVSRIGTSFGTHASLAAESRRQPSACRPERPSALVTTEALPTSPLRPLRRLDL